MARTTDDQINGSVTLLFSGRVDAASTYKCKPRTGYSRCKNVIIFIRVLAAHATPPSVAFSLYHGPTPDIMADWGSVIAATAVSVTTVIAGATDVDTDGQFGDALQGVIAVTGSNWASIEVYEVRKPF